MRGDNYDELRELPDECVDLIYLDPPFNSNQFYVAAFGDKGRVGRQLRDIWRWNAGSERALQDLEQRAFRSAAYKRLLDCITGVRLQAGETSDMAAYILYMARRLIEMRRVLKRTGSIYLHCDPHANAYLRILMNAIFGANNFRNEIVWLRRHERHNLARKHMGRAHDTIFWYAKTATHHYNIQYLPHSEEYISKTYNQIDEKGRYTTFPCTNETGGNKPYKFRGITRAWRFEPSRMEELYQSDMLVQLRPSSPYRYKKYLDDTQGVKIQDLWDDIPGARGDERTGYPTQKPLALLERIIKASSNPGDLVLDPFCGCGTAADAAALLGRKYLGIDISGISVRVMQQRLESRGDAAAPVVYGLE